MLLFHIILFIVAFNIFAGLEIYLGFRDKGRQDDSSDANSLRTITRLRNAAFVIAIVSFFLPVVPVPGSRNIHLDTGAGLILTGFIIRVWAIGKLGEYFTSLVMTHENQTLITDGPYRYIRHPGYTGGLLFYLGLGVATGSIPGLVIIMTIMSYGIHRRIKVEERVMISYFGEEYIDYMKRTRKLIPLLY